VFDYLIVTDDAVQSTASAAKAIGDAGAAQRKAREEGEGGGREDGDDSDDDDDAASSAAAAAAAAAAKPAKKQKKRRRDGEYGASRGVDFRHVKFVVNVELPASGELGDATNYKHRVGRTARGGAAGTALSLVDASSAAEVALVTTLRATLPPIPAESLAGEMGALVADEGLELPRVCPDATLDALVALPPPPPRAQPARLALDLGLLEPLRYRVEDVRRAVTKVAVRRARAAELRREMLNSEKLRAHFEDNPDDLKILRHDTAAASVLSKQRHLGRMPDYLMPAALQESASAADAAAKRSKKRRKRIGGSGGGRNKRSDPLSTFSTGMDVGELEGAIADAEDQAVRAAAAGGGGGGGAQAWGIQPTMRVTGGDNDSAGIVTAGAMRSGKLGRSTSGRKAWKMAHGKGEFSNKPQKSKGKKGKKGQF